MKMNVIATSALSLSLIFVSDCDEDVINSILTSFMVFQPNTLDDPFSTFLSVALALNFLG